MNPRPPILLLTLFLSSVAAFPQTIHAVRVGPGVIGIEWTPGGGAAPAGYILSRSQAPEGPYQLLAKRPADRPWYLDAAIEPGTLYFYKVASFIDETAPSAETGPTCAWDNDQIVPNGSFELEEPGPIPSPDCPIWWLRRAYNRGTPVVIAEGGPDGSRCLEVRCANASISGGLHSMLIPMIEGESWYQDAWARTLPGASVLVGRCFYNADRQTIRGEGISKPYDYARGGSVRPDGWQQHTGEFIAPVSTRYVQLWLIGYQARNTFWLDGATVIDRTSRRVREFDLEQFKQDVSEALQTSSAAREHAQGIEQLEQQIATIRQRMATDLEALTPLEYRQLLVDLDRAQTAYAELVWNAKTIAILGP
jgi:hypothetical protein